MPQNIIFIVGLTGVGKSTTIRALEESGTNFYLLPNRRTLTDNIVIAEMQKLQGEKVIPVTDRLKRFELSALYRKYHPEGMAYVVKQYIKEHAQNIREVIVFDNLRGENEVAGAINLFSENTRFIMLDAPEEVRLKRLLGREDTFDQISAKNLLESKEENIPSIEGIEQKEIAKALKIIQTEKKNYDAEKTAKYLHENLTPKRLCYLDTSKLSIPETIDSIQRWL